jgi:hypothetical protein
MITSCFIVPIAQADLERVAWTIQSIRKHCHDYRIFLLLDMDRGSHKNQTIARDDIEIIYPARPSNRHWGRILQMQNRAMLHALQRSDISPDCVFVKMDADALLIRDGFVERAQMIFSKNQKCGQIGQVFVNISGAPLLNRGWFNYFNRRMTFLGHIKAFGLFLRHCGNPVGAVKATLMLRTMLIKALRNGWHPGTFAIGGAYILRLDAVKEMHKNGWLTESPFCFWPNPGEDVMLTPHLYACGYDAIDDVGPNGLFAVCGKEPWIHPFELAKRGHYLIHPIKYGVTKSQPELSERQLAETLLGASNNPGLSVRGIASKSS